MFDGGGGSPPQAGGKTQNVLNIFALQPFGIKIYTMYFYYCMPIDGM